MESPTTTRAPIKPPKNVVYAFELLAFSLYLGLMPILACRLLAGTDVIPNAIMLILTILLYVAMWVFFYLLTKGAKWIRTIFLVLFFTGFIAYIPVMGYYFKITPVAGLLYLLQTTIQILAIILLLTPDGNRWYREQTRLMGY